MKRVVDKIPRPPGALPARAQTWVLLGLTAVIAITLVTFPGQADRISPEAVPEGSAGSGPGAGSAPGVGSVENAADRIREEAAREAERRLQEDLGLPGPREDGLPHPPQPMPPERDGFQESSAGTYGTPDLEAQIEQEERLRRYRSLRTPPLVRSSRGEFEERPSESAAVDAADDSGPDRGPASDRASDGPGPPAANDRPSEPPAPVDRTADRQEPERRLHVLRPGDYLEAVLANRLSGDFAGPVDAMVSADVYDRSRQHLLIPQGTRATGTATRVEDWEQTRLAVTFRHLYLPDGRSVPLGESPGLNQIGETGLRDRVNRHYASSVAAAGAVGALAGLSQAVSPQDAFVSRLGGARVSTGAGLSRSAERILDRYINRLPKVTIREGHRIRIYLTGELALPAYRP